MKNESLKPLDRTYRNAHMARVAKERKKDENSPVFLPSRLSETTP